MTLSIQIFIAAVFSWVLIFGFYVLTTTIKRIRAERNQLDQEITKFRESHMEAMSKSILMNDILNTDRYTDTSVYASMTPEEFCRLQLAYVLKHKNDWVSDIVLMNGLLIPAMHHLYNKIFTPINVLPSTLKFPIKNTDNENCIRLSMLNDDVYIDIPVDNYALPLYQLYIQLSTIAISIDDKNDILNYMINNKSINSGLHDVLQYCWRTAELSHIRDAMLNSTYCCHLPKYWGSNTLRIASCTITQAIWFKKTITSDTTIVADSQVEPIVLSIDSLTNEFVSNLLNGIQVMEHEINHFIFTKNDIIPIELKNSLQDILSFQRKLESR